jgi:flagellar biosynthesis protein FlhG
MRTRLVIAFGGGKGGVGKSLVCSAVATAMARTGARVVLLDADLGAANMHTLLGVTNPATTLDDFWSGRIPDIEGVCLSTPIDGLRLLSGAASILRAANPRRRERERLARAFLELDADVLVIDLGAGTQDNTLDFFNMASEGLVVTGTEPTAIQNAYAFIKAAVYRLLDRTFRDAPGARALVARAAAARGADRIESVDKLLDALHGAEPSWAERAATVLARGHLGLVVNQAGPREAQRVLGAIGVVCQRYLSLELPLIAALPSDPAVVRAVHRMTPVLLEEPHCAFARAATALADQLLTSGRRVDVDALLASMETPEVGEASSPPLGRPPTSLLEALSHAGVIPAPSADASTPVEPDPAPEEEQDWSAVAAEADAAVHAIDHASDEPEAATPEDLREDAAAEVARATAADGTTDSLAETTDAPLPDPLRDFPAFPDDEPLPMADGAPSQVALDSPETDGALEAGPEAQPATQTESAPPAAAPAPSSPAASDVWSVLDEALASAEAATSAERLDSVGLSTGAETPAETPASAHVELEAEAPHTEWPAFDEVSESPEGDAWSALDDALASAEAAAGARRSVELAADAGAASDAPEAGPALDRVAPDAGPSVAEPPHPSGGDEAEVGDVEARFDDPMPELGFDAAFEAWAEEAAPELSREFVLPMEVAVPEAIAPAFDAVVLPEERIEPTSAPGDAALEAWVSSLVSGVPSEPAAEQGQVSASSLQLGGDVAEDPDDSGDQPPEFDLSWGGGLPPDVSEVPSADALGPIADERAVVDRVTSEWPDVLMAPDESGIEERSQPGRPLVVDETLELPDLGALRSQLAHLLQPVEVLPVARPDEAEVAVGVSTGDEDPAPDVEDQSEWSGWGELAAEVEAAERGEVVPVSLPTPTPPATRPSSGPVAPAAAAPTRVAELPAPSTSPARIPERPTMRLPLMSPHSVALPGLSSTIAAALVREAMGSGGGQRPQAEAWDDAETFDPWESGALSAGAPQVTAGPPTEGALMLEDVVETESGWLYVRSADLGATKALVRQTVLRSGRVLHSVDVGYGASVAGNAAASGLEVLGRSHAELVQRLRVGRLVFNDTVPGARR